MLPLYLKEFSDFKNQKSFSRGVVIKFRDEKEGDDFCVSFKGWTKDAVKQGDSLEMFYVFFLVLSIKK